MEQQRADDIDRQARRIGHHHESERRVVFGQTLQHRRIGGDAERHARHDKNREAGQSHDRDKAGGAFENRLGFGMGAELDLAQARAGGEMPERLDPEADISERCRRPAAGEQPEEAEFRPFRGLVGGACIQRGKGLGIQQHEQDRRHHQQQPHRHPGPDQRPDTGLQAERTVAEARHAGAVALQRPHRPGCRQPERRHRRRRPQRRQPEIGPG